MTYRKKNNFAQEELLKKKIRKIYREESVLRETNLFEKNQHRRRVEPLLDDLKTWLDERLKRHVLPRLPGSGHENGIQGPVELTVTV